MAKHARQVPSSSYDNSFRARNAHARARKEFVTYDTSAIRPKQSKAPTVIALIVIIAVIAIACYFILPNLFAQPDNKGDLPADQNATIIIQSGDTASSVAEQFEEARLVKSAQAFLTTMSQVGADTSIIPGTYTFAGQTEPEEMATRLKNGESDALPKITVVEGYTLETIAATIEEASSGQITAEDFTNAASDASQWVGQYSFVEGAGTHSLEGFLFPKTYDIESSDTAQTMIQKMLDQFQTEVMGLDFSYTESQGMSLYEVITLASIVQRESNYDNMATVAGVFFNRLNSDYPYLESDATTAYYVGHDPTADEVHADNEYSTYTHAGLPPTPINSPSLNAIAAVLAPEQTDYMYFYTNEDGSYAFSVTYDEHQEAIANDN